MKLRPATPSEVLPMLAPAARFSTTAESLEHLAHSGLCFLLEEQGKPVCAWSLQCQGDEIFILAAAGRAGCDLTEVGLTVIEQQAQGFASVAFQTRRRGLMRKAQALGYLPAGSPGRGQGTIMRKVLK